MEQTLCFNFDVVELCDLYIKQMKSNQTLYPVMQKLFEEMDNIALNLQGHLQTFGAMHIGEIIKLNAKSEFDTDALNITAHKELEIMLIEKGSPADWAFTLCCLIDSVSFNFKISREASFFKLIKKFVFANYAYKLQGAKRVALIANLCACMHYDTEPYRLEPFGWQSVTVRKLTSMVDVSLRRFGVGSKKNLIDEVGIYLAFMCLITADVAKHVAQNDIECSNYIAKANLKSSSNSSRFFGLWEFLILYSKMIQDNEQHEKGFQGLQERAILLPDCQARWKKGFCAIRNGKFPDCFVNTCLKKLGNSC